MAKLYQGNEWGGQVDIVRAATSKLYMLFEVWEHTLPNEKFEF